MFESFFIGNIVARPKWHHPKDTIDMQKAPLIKSLIAFYDGEIAIGAIESNFRISDIENILQSFVKTVSKPSENYPFAAQSLGLMVDFYQSKLKILPYSVKIADPFSNSDFLFKVKYNKEIDNGVSDYLSWSCEDAFGNEITDFTDSLGIERIRYVKKGGAIQEYDLEKVTSENNEYLCGIVAGKGFRRFLKDNIISREKV